MAPPEPPTRDKIADSLKAIDTEILKSPSLKPRLSSALGIDMSWTPGEGPTPVQRLGRTSISPVAWRQDMARERAYNASLSTGQKMAMAFAEGPVMKILMGLTKPLSMVVGGLKETIDYAGGGDWSTSDWRKAVDETYFFGDLLHDFDILQGEEWYDKWGARALGFTGDVVLDPFNLLGRIGKGVMVSTMFARGFGKIFAKMAIRSNILRSLDDDALRLVKNVGLGDGLADDVLGRVVDDIVSGTSNVVTRLDDGAIALTIGKQSKRTGFIADDLGQIVPVDDVGRVILDADTVGDVATLMNAELRAGKRGASAVTTSEVRLGAKHMFESGMDQAGRFGDDIFRVADEGWRGSMFQNMKQVNQLDLKFGFKIPLTGPVGRMIFRHNLQRPVGITLMTSRMPGVETFMRGVPQATRAMAFGLKHGESGLFGWMKRGGRLPELRKLMRTEWLDDPIKRHAGRRMLHAAGRGDAMARTVKQEMIRHANDFFQKVKASGVDTKDVYHALAGDETAMARIGQELTDEGVRFMATLREIANTRAGYEFLGEANNYVPRVLSDKARDYLDKKGIGLVTRRHRRPYTQSGFEKQRKYVSREDFDGLVEAEYKKIRKKNAKATMDRARRNVEGRGIQSDFLGDELLRPGTALGDGTVAKDVEQQIADIMERMGISYALFDDDLTVSIPAYIEAVSKRTGEVFTETLLRDKGIFLERMVELIRFPNAHITRATRVVRDAQMAMMKTGATLQTLFKKAAEEAAPTPFLRQQIVEHEAILLQAEREYLDAASKLDNLVGDALDLEADLIHKQGLVDDLLLKINVLRAGQEGLDLATVIDAFKQNQFLLNELAELLDDGGILKEEWARASASTASLVQLEDRIISVFGDLETFQAFNRAFDNLPREAMLAGGLPENELLSLAEREVLPDVGERFVKAEIIEEPGFGAVGTPEQDEYLPTVMFQITKSDGTVVQYSEQQVQSMFVDSRKIIQDLDERGVGAWLGVEMTLASDPMEPLLLDHNPVAQLNASRNRISEEAGQAAGRLEELFPYSNLEPSDVGVGAIPTPEAVMIAKAKIVATMDEAIRSGNPRALVAKNNGTLQEWLKTTDQEFQEAIWTYYSNITDLPPARFTNSEQLDDFVRKLDIQARQIMADNNNILLPAEQVKFTVTDKDGNVQRDIGLAEYVTALRYQVGMDEGAFTGKTPFAAHRKDVIDITESGEEFVILGAGGENGVSSGGAPGHPDGSVPQGSNWTNSQFDLSPDKPAAPKGGSNPGFLVKVPLDATNPVEGPGNYFYVKTYLDNTKSVDPATPLDVFGAILRASESGKHRIQGETVANALYMAFGSSRGPGRYGIHSTGHVPVSGAAPINSSALGESWRGNWTITSSYKGGLAHGLNTVPMADQVRVQFRNGMFDIASVEDVGYSLRDGTAITRDMLASDPVPMSLLAGEQFIVDVLVANWDTFGLRGDNIAVSQADGTLFRLDNGGVFHYGAMGGFKHEVGGYDWRGVHELLPGGGATKGTYLGGLEEMGIFAQNSAAQTAKKLKIGEYAVPTWQQFEVAMDLPNGPGFTGEVEQQIKTLLRVRDKFGGWTGFVRNVLGEHASDTDIALFVQWLDVRSKRLAEAFNLEYTAPDSLQMIANVASDYGVAPEALSTTLENLPYETIQQTAKELGFRSWLNKKAHELSGLYYDLKTEMPPAVVALNDPRSQWVKLMDLTQARRAVRMDRTAEKVVSNPNLTQRKIDERVLDSIGDLVADGRLTEMVNGPAIHPNALDERLLFSDTAEEVLAEIADDEALILDDIAEAVGLGGEVDELTPEGVLGLDLSERPDDVFGWDAQVQRQIEEAFPGTEAVEPVEGAADLQAWLSAEGLPGATVPTKSADTFGIASMEDVPWTAAHRESGKVGVVVVDAKGNVIMRMPITQGTGSTTPLGNVLYTHTVVDKTRYINPLNPQGPRTLAKAAIEAASDAMTVNVQLVGFLPVIEGHSTPYFVARLAPGSPTVSADGPQLFTRSTGAREEILNLFHQTDWRGLLDPGQYLGRQNGGWTDTIAGLNATLPPVVYGSVGSNGGTPRTFHIGVRMPQGAARNIKMFGVAPHMKTKFAEAAMMLSGIGAYKEADKPIMQKAQDIIQRVMAKSTPPSQHGGFGQTDMLYDMLESIHDADPTLFKDLVTFARTNDVINQRGGTKQTGVMFANIVDTVESLSKRGISQFDQLSWRDKVGFIGYLHSVAHPIGPYRFALKMQIPHPVHAGDTSTIFSVRGAKEHAASLNTVRALNDTDFEQNLVNYIAEISPGNGNDQYWYRRMHFEQEAVLAPMTSIWGKYRQLITDLTSQPLLKKRGDTLWARPSAHASLTGKGELDVAGGKTFWTDKAKPEELKDQRILRMYVRSVEVWKRKMSADGYNVAVWGNGEHANFDVAAGLPGAGTSTGTPDIGYFQNFMVTNPRAVTFEQIPIVGGEPVQAGARPWAIHELGGSIDSSVMDWQALIDDYEATWMKTFGEPGVHGGDYEDSLQQLNEALALRVEESAQVANSIQTARTRIEDTRTAAEALRVEEMGAQVDLDELLALEVAGDRRMQVFTEAQNILTRLGAGLDEFGNEIPLEELSDDLRNLRIATNILGEGDAETLRMAANALDEGEDALSALSILEPVGDDDTFYPLTRLQDREEILESLWVSGFRPFGTHTQGPEDMVEAMTAVTKFRSQGGWGTFLRQYDKIHNLMKGYMIMKPGFHMRNFFSAVFMNYLHGVDLASYRQFQRAYWRFQYDEAVATGLTRRAARMKKVMVSRGIWGKASADDLALVRTMRDGGILGGTQGQVAGEFLSAPQVAGKKINFGLINPLNPRNAPLRISREVGVGTETFVRGVMGFDTLKKGGTVDDAFDSVVKFHFDYDDLSDFERKVVKRIVPFYTWTKKALPLMLEQIGKNPAKMTAYIKAKHEMELGEEKPGIIPEYFKRQGAIQMPWKYKGENMFILPDLPFKTPLELLDPALALKRDMSVAERLRVLTGSFGTQVTPLIKAPYEWEAKKNLWKGYTFDGRYQQVPTVFYRTPGLMHMLQPLGLAVKQNDIWLMRDYNLHTMAQLLPTFSDMRRLFPSEERYQQRTLSTWMSFMFGIGLRTNTLDEQQRTLRSEYYKQLDELRDMRNLMGATERAA